MAGEPDVLYGADVGSSYQGQQTMLSKHFLAREPASGAGGDARGRAPPRAGRASLARAAASVARPIRAAAGRSAAASSRGKGRNLLTVSYWPGGQIA
jgi:hypothetical protein